MLLVRRQSGVNRPQLIYGVLCCALITPLVTTWSSASAEQPNTNEYRSLDGSLSSQLTRGGSTSPSTGSRAPSGSGTPLTSPTT